MNDLEILVNIKDILTLLVDIFKFFKRRIFWKNNQIVYINDNVKKTDIWDIKSINKLMNHKKIEIYTNIDNKLSVQIHLYKMKLQHRLIIKNMGEESDFHYCGFACVPFAIYDGYKIGDINGVYFYDRLKNKDKVISFNYKKEKKKREVTNYDIDSNCNEVNLLVESSYTILDKTINNNNKNYRLKIEKIDDVLSREYLNSVYYEMTSFLDQCHEKGIKVVNLYCSSRQAVSFTVGQSIQKHHPIVKAYEFIDGVYTWNLNIKRGELEIDD